MKKRLLMLTALLLALMIPVASLAAGFTFNTTTLEGKSFKSTIMKGYKLTMVNFWAEWCGPCMSEMPHLSKIYMDNDNLMVIGAYVGSNVPAAIAAAKQALIKYPLVNLQGDLLTYSYKSNYIPASYFFDCNGEPVGDKDGYIGYRTYDEWKNLIEELMEKAPDPSPDVYEVTKSGGIYRVDKDAGVAVFKAPASATASSVKILAKVDGYKVTEIAAKAFYKNTSLKSLTIGKNVKVINAKALTGCKNLEKIKVSTKLLTDESVAAGSVKNINAYAVFICPSGMAKTYHDLFINKGAKKTCTFK